MHSVLIEVAGFPLYTYGLVLSIAIVSGILMAVRQGMRRGYDPFVISDAGVWTVVMGLLGARLAFVLQGLDYYMAHPWSIMSFREGGISIQGGMLFGFAATAYCFWRARVPASSGLDVYSAPVILGMAIGRIGCVFQGCCVGKVCNLPWGIVYPASTGLGTLPRHPSQIYELLLDLVLMVVVMKVYERANFSGQAFWTAIAGYGVVRFLTEFFRDGSMMGPLTLAQWFSLGFFLIGMGGVLGWYGHKPVVRGPGSAAAGDAESGESGAEGKAE